MDGQRRLRTRVGVAVARLCGLAGLVMLAAAVAPVWAGKAHEHGVARADVAVEAGRITLSLELPLESLAGFERAPRTEAERNAVVAALAKLQEAAKVVRIDAAAGCGNPKVELLAPVWSVGSAAPAAPPAGNANRAQEHGDLEARYEFRCSHSDKASHLELGLFDAFARLKRIEVQAVAAKGQMKLVLKRGQSRVALVR